MCYWLVCAFMSLLLWNVGLWTWLWHVTYHNYIIIINSKHIHWPFAANPRWRQATLASALCQLSSAIVPQIPLKQISIRPSILFCPFTNLKSPKLQLGLAEYKIILSMIIIADINQHAYKPTSCNWLKNNLLSSLGLIHNYTRSITIVNSIVLEWFKINV